MKKIKRIDLKVTDSEEKVIKKFCEIINMTKAGLIRKALNVFMKSKIESLYSAYSELLCNYVSEREQNFNVKDLWETAMNLVKDSKMCLHEIPIEKVYIKYEMDCYNKKLLSNI